MPKKSENTTTYIDYEMTGVDITDGITFKIRGTGGETRWISLGSPTAEKLMEFLRNTSECGFGW